MAVKKKKITIKSKNIFDHLNDIMIYKQDNYYSKLSGKEKDDYNIYMIQRFLSMIPEYINFINEINPYIYKLPKEQYHNLMCTVIPKKKIFINYIKRSPQNKLDEWIINCLMKLFLVSEQEAINYVELLTADSIKELGKMFAIEEKEIKKSIKNF